MERCGRESYKQAMDELRERFDADDIDEFQFAELAGALRRHRQGAAAVRPRCCPTSTTSVRRGRISTSTHDVSCSRR